MKKIISLIFISCLTCFAFANEIKKSQVSTQELLELLNSDYKEIATIDEDDDLRIADESLGIKLFATVDSDRVFIKFTTGWKKSDNISDARLSKIINWWNYNKIFATASWNDSSIHLEYFMAFDGGVNSENFNSTIEWLFSIAEAFGEYLEGEDAI